MMQFDKLALPGVICTSAGGIICALWLGWDYGLAFLIGGILGSTRFRR
jgi:hypothetical protein